MSEAKLFFLQLFQVSFVLLLSPLIAGILSRMKEFVQGKVGPSIFQPYRDLRKLFQKERLIPEGAGPLYRVAPYLYFAAPLIVTLLIPVLTTFPLFMAFAGDMMAGGFILGLGTYVLLVGAMAGASPYGAIGSSRVRFVSMSVEPVLILVLFCVSFVAHATIPYIVNQALWGLGWSPIHLLLIAAFFAILLAETGRIPVDNPSSHHEFSMIDHNRVYDYSGADLALLEWGGWMKYVALGTIFLNVIVSPYGLSSSGNLIWVALSIVAVFVKFVLLDVGIVWVESSFGKLRLLRISEFMASAGMAAGLAALLGIFHVG